MKQVTLKLDGMRKAQDFVVYPKGDENALTIQSETYIAKVDPETGAGILAGPHASGAYFHHLAFGKRRTVKLTTEQIAEVKGAQPEKGDIIGAGVVVG
jgi:hypothetical protein